MVAHSIVEIYYGFRFKTDAAYIALGPIIKSNIGVKTLEPLPSRETLHEVLYTQGYTSERARITDLFEHILLDIIGSSEVQFHGRFDHLGEITVSFGPPACQMNSEGIVEGETVVSCFDPGVFQAIETDMFSNAVRAADNLMKLGIHVEEIQWYQVEYTR